MTRYLLPLVLVAALVCTGLYFLVASGSRGTRATPPGSVARSGAGTAEQAPLPELEAPAAPRETGATAQRQGIVRALDTPAAPEQGNVAPGPERVLGRVLDSEGQPVAGARVVAADRPGTPLYGPIVSFGPQRTRAREETSTDGQGRFEFPGLAAGSASFGVRASGFAPFERRDVPLSASREVTLDPFVLSTGAILTGQVVGPAGHGIPDVELVPLTESQGPFRFFGTSVLPTVATTAADGRFRLDELACGAYSILLRHPDHPELEVKGLAESPGVEVAGLIWRLEAGATIAGVATGIPEGERGELEVRASKVDGNGAFRMGAGQGRTASVEAGGRFMLRGLAAETDYELRLRRRQDGGGFGFERSRSTPVRARSGEQGVVVPYLTEAAVTFEVRDRGTNQPVTRFLVEFGLDWPQALRGEDGQRISQHPGGRVRLGALRPRSADERLTIRIEATGYDDVERNDIAVGIGQEFDLGVIYLDPVPVLRLTVLGDADEPVAGARVRLSKRSSGGLLEGDFSVEIARPSGTFGFGGGRTGRTDEEGVVELSSYPGEPCTLRVTADDYAPAEEELVLSVEARTEHTLRLDRGGEVLVTVLDAAGLPLAGAEIRHRPMRQAGAVEFLPGPGGPGRASLVSDGEGQVLVRYLADGAHGFRLDEGAGPQDGAFLLGGEEEGAFVGSLDVGPGAPGDANWTEVEVRGGERATLTLRASPRGTLTGRVREAGKPLAGAKLELRREASAPGDSGFTFPGMGPAAPSARTDGTGAYRFEEVIAESYHVKVEHPTRRMPEEFPVEVRVGQTTFDLDLTVSFLEGRVTDADGQGLAGVRLEARPGPSSGGVREGDFEFVIAGAEGVFQSGGAGGGDPVLSDADGNYSLRGVTPGVDLVVHASGDGVQPATSEVVRVGPDETRRKVDFVLQAGGTLAVEVLLADGTPANFCLVTAQPEGEQGSPPRTTFVQRGTASLTGLAPGRWRVSAQRMGPGAESAQPVSEVVEVRGREKTPVTLRLP